MLRTGLGQSEHVDTESAIVSAIKQCQKQPEIIPTAGRNSLCRCEFQPSSGARQDFMSNSPELTLSAVPLLEISRPGLDSVTIRSASWLFIQTMFR